MPSPQTAPKSKAEIGLYLTADVLSLHYPPATKMVLAEILQLGKGGPCQPSDGHFVERLHISRDTASRAVQQLVADGLLSRVYDYGSRYGVARILTPADPDYPQNQAGQLPGDYPQNQASTTRKIRHALPAKSGTKKEVKKEREVRTPPTPLTASRPVGGGSASLLKNQPDAQTTGGAAPAADPYATPGFAAFWNVWPRTEKKKDAAAAFSKLQPADQTAAADHATRWLREHARQVERGAVPYAATWLRAEQWHDGPEPPDRSPKPGQPAPPPAAARTTARQNPDWK